MEGTTRDSPPPLLLANDSFLQGKFIMTKYVCMTQSPPVTRTTLLLLLLCQISYINNTIFFIYNNNICINFKHIQKVK